MGLIPPVARPAVRIPAQGLFTSYVQPLRIPSGRGVVMGVAKINGEPVIDTYVGLLHATSGIAVATTLTDGEGNYVFTNVGEGHYSVIAIDPARGYRSRVAHTYVEHIPDEPVFDPDADPNIDPVVTPPPGGGPNPNPQPEPEPLLIEGNLMPAYVGIPYYNASALGDPWRVTGGDYPRVTGWLPPGLTFERGASSRLAVNVFGVPLEPWTGTLNIDIGGTVHTQVFSVLPRPEYGMLDFSRRRPAAQVTFSTLDTAHFIGPDGVVGSVGANSGLLRAEIQVVVGPAVIGIHAGHLRNLFLSDTGNPAGTYGRYVSTPGTYIVLLNANNGRIWISDELGNLPGNPAAGTGQTATLSLANSDDGLYRVGIYGYAGAVVGANFGNIPWTYPAVGDFDGWRLPNAITPAIWTSTGALHAQVGSPQASGQLPTGTLAGILDSSRTAPSPGTYGGLRATLGKSSGKWQFEIRADGESRSAIGPTLSLGLVKSGFDFTAGKAIGYVGATDSIGIAHTHPDAQTAQEYTEVHTNFGGVHTAARYERVEQCTYTFGFDGNEHTLIVTRNGVPFVTIEGIPAGEWFPAMSANWWPRGVIESVALKFPIEGFAPWVIGEEPEEPEEPGESGYAEAVLADAPRAFWMLDEASGAFVDLAGEFDLDPGSGAVRGAPSIIPTVTGGAAGQAAVGAIGTTTAAVILTGAEQSLTLVAALNLTAAPAEVAGIVHQGDFGLGGSLGVAVFVQPDGAVRLQTNVSGSWYLPISGAGLVVVDEPLLLGVEYDAGSNKVHFYKNGVLHSSADHSAGLGTANTTFAVGRGNVSGQPSAYSMTGSLQGVAVWPSAVGAAAHLRYAQAAGLA